LIDRLTEDIWPCKQPNYCRS